MKHAYCFSESQPWCGERFLEGSAPERLTEAPGEMPRPGRAGPRSSQTILGTCISAPGGPDPSLRKGPRARLPQVWARTLIEPLLL